VSDHGRFVRLKAYQAADLVRRCVNDTGTDEVVGIRIDPFQYRQSRSNQLQYSTVTWRSIQLLALYIELSS